MQFGCCNTITVNNFNLCLDDYTRILGLIIKYCHACMLILCVTSFENVHTNTFRGAFIMIFLSFANFYIPRTAYSVSTTSYKVPEISKYPNEAIT